MQKKKKKEKRKNSEVLVCDCQEFQKDTEKMEFKKTEIT